MDKILNYIRNLFEVRGFGVCSYLGEKLGIPYHRIRLFFVYSTFIANWSPIIIYLSIAFVVNIRKYIKIGKRQMWNS